MNQRIHSLRPAALALALAALSLQSDSVAVAADVKAYRGQMDIPTYPWWPAVKHP